MQLKGADIKADAPSWGRASASAGFVIHAGNHQGEPCTLSLSNLRSPVLYWASYENDAERRSLFFSFLGLSRLFADL